MLSANKRTVCILLAICMLAPAAYAEDKKDFIKWVDFTPTLKALEKALAFDIASQNEEVKLDWIELLAYCAAKNGGKFGKNSEKEIASIADKLKNGADMDELTEGLKYYNYYFEAYTAVLGEFVGTYLVQEEENGGAVWKEKYGLKVFSPIARGFPFTHYDDFGVGRTYGYKRRHLGHDLMAQVGTPVMAVETSVVEVMGWNKYGGWRVGLRSLDGKRYYYFAHLRKNRPYHETLKEGEVVKAGGVIGYVGRSGYSTTENTNNIDESHLHFGMQLIFDESQKEGPKEIWIDTYAIVMLLQKNRSETVRNPDTKEHYRRYDFWEPLLGNKTKPK